MSESANRDNVAHRAAEGWTGIWILLLGAGIVIWALAHAGVLGDIDLDSEVDLFAMASFNAIGLVAISPLNAIGLVAIGGVNSIGVITIGTVNSIGFISIGGVNALGVISFGGAFGSYGLLIATGDLVSKDGKTWGRQAAPVACNALGRRLLHLDG